jgi:predicted ATPase
MMLELVAQRGFRIICATHSPILIDAPETCVINLDHYVNRNVPLEQFGVEGASTIQ